ncbi:MAG TPA: glycosyltransferase family 4 protein [Gemmatimonadaceae bacterium]|nr:glycosyltransferase family 4 protein [Gemmatimonadaceae bacterium]
MKRVAFMMTHPTQYHSPWFRALAASGEIDIHVYYGSTPSAEQQGEGFGVKFEWDVPLLEGYPYTLLRNSGSGSLRDFAGIDTPGINALVAKERYDAWVINGWRTKSEWRTIEACWGERIPMFIRGDSNLLTPRPLATRLVKHFLYRRWIPRFRCYLTVGTLNEQYYEHYGADRRRFVPVRHFVDNEWFAVRADAERSKSKTRREIWGIREGSVVALFAGKFITKKQPMDAIRAIEKIVQMRSDAELRSDVELLMVGDGPLRRECEEFAARRKLPVVFAGFLNQAAMPAAYAAADMLVMPSTHDETWGLVVNEAMASGIPAIVSDQVGCAPDLIVEGETGSVFKAGDVDALAKAISSLASDRGALERTAAATRARVANFSLDSAVRNTILAANEFA